MFFWRHYRNPPKWLLDAARSWYNSGSEKQSIHTMKIFHGKQYDYKVKIQPGSGKGRMVFFSRRRRTWAGCGGSFLILILVGVVAGWVVTSGMVSDPFNVPINYQNASTEQIEDIIWIDYLNQLRSENGEKPVSIDERAMKLAQARVEDMINYDYYAHTNPVTGETANSIKSEFGFEKSLSENILNNMDLHISNQTVFNMWMSSPGHRYNLLDSLEGVGFYRAGEYAVFIGV